MPRIIQEPAGGGGYANLDAYLDANASAYWPLTEADDSKPTTIADYIGSNDLTAGTDTVIVSTDQDYGGVGGVVQAIDNDPPLTLTTQPDGDNFTIGIVIRVGTAAISSADNDFLFFSSTTPVHYCKFSNGDLIGRLRDTDEYIQWTPYTVGGLSANTTHMLVCTYDSTSGEYIGYWDGSEVVSATASTTGAAANFTSYPIKFFEGGATVFNGAWYSTGGSHDTSAPMFDSLFIANSTWTPTQVSDAWGLV